MKILGIEKFTALDYPGKLACVIFTAGCNFRCPFCYNPELVLPEKIAEQSQDFIPFEAVLGFLKTRVGKLDGVVFCGGEPTLQTDLYEKIKEVKKMGFLVKLDTNGRDFDLVKKLVDEKLIDYIAVDLKSSLAKYNLLTGGKADNDFMKNYKNLVKFLIQEGKVEYEFRTTVIKGYHTMEDFEEMGKLINGAQNFYIQNYRKEKTLDPNFDGLSFTIYELQEIQKVFQKYIKNVGIRN